MKTICKLKAILTLILVWTICNIAQQQQHISWPSLADSPWPFIRGDMQATGRSKYVGPSTNNVIWRKDMPLGIMQGPVIGYSNILYTGTDAIYSGGKNFFYAINNDGQTFWTFETESGFPNDIVPIISIDSTIYFSSRNRSIYSLNPNGELNWEIKNIMWGWVHGYMTIAKNGDLFVPSEDTLVIIDPTGIVKEKRTIEGLNGRSFVFTTTGDTIFYFTGGGDITEPGSLNAANLDGELIWSYNFATHNLGAPLVDNSNKIYVFGTDSVFANNFFLYCIKSDGTLDWRYRVDYYRLWASPTIDKDGNIIFSARSNTDMKNIIISLDYYGNQNWLTQLPGEYEESLVDHGLVCDAEGKIYCGSTYAGYFYCLSNNGDILWSLDLGEYEYDSSPAIGSDGTLYIGTNLSSLSQNQEQNLIAVRDTVVFVKEEKNSIISLELEQNYPNPFNSTTNIRYAIPQSGKVSLIIYDLMGTEVAKILDRYQEAGSYDVIFQPKVLASGIYFYTLTSGNFTATKKLILLK